MSPHPCAVGQREQSERQYEPQQQGNDALGHVVVGHLANLLLFKGLRRVCLLYVRQVVMAPLAYDGAVFQQQQSGVAAYDGLQRDAVGEAEGVFSSRNLPPPLNVLVRARRQAVEAVAVLIGILVQLVDEVEPGVVGLFQVGRHHQEHVARVVEQRLGDVLAVLHVLDEEIGRNSSYV